MKCYKLLLHFLIACAIYLNKFKKIIILFAQLHIHLGYNQIEYLCYMNFFPIQIQVFSKGHSKRKKKKRILHKFSMNSISISTALYCTNFIPKHFFY